MAIVKKHSSCSRAAHHSGKSISLGIFIWCCLLLAPQVLSAPVSRLILYNVATQGCGNLGQLQDIAAPHLACLNALPPMPGGSYPWNYRNLRPNPAYVSGQNNALLLDYTHPNTGEAQTGWTGEIYSECPTNYGWVGSNCELPAGTLDPKKVLGGPPPARTSDQTIARPESGRCVGNPCDPSTGNKFQIEDDYLGSGPFPLRFSRIYNSQAGAAGSNLGFNWRHNYSAFVALHQVQGGLSTVYARRADGRTIHFTLQGSTWLPDADVTERLEQLPDGWKLTTNQDEVETYDTSGKLISFVNRAGLTQTFTYYTTGVLTGFLQSVTDPFGRNLTLTYDTQLRISRMTDPTGADYLYTYSTDGFNNLVSVTYPGSPPRARTYYYENQSAYTSGANLPNVLTRITDENNDRFAYFYYDGSGRAIRTHRAAEANRYDLAYPSTSTTDVTAFINPDLSATRTYTFNTINGVKHLTGLTGPACPTCGPQTAGFNSSTGFIEFQTDWNGNRVNYQINSRGLEESRTEALTAAGGTTSATRTVETQWHATLRLPTLITEKDGAGAVLRTTSMTHDANGNVLTRTVTAGSNSRTWTYTYNANGSVLTMNGPRTDISDITTYAYYPNDAICPGAAPLGCRGQFATITNALGHLTQITEYNAHGQPLTIIDPNGLTTTLGYDAHQRLTSRNVGGEITGYEYDGVGQLTKVTLPDSSFLSYTYDAAHRLKEIGDNLGNRIVYTLDAMGNRTLEEVRDAANQLAQTRNRVYNALNRLFQEIGAQSQTTQYGYDNQGNVTSIDGPLAGTGDTTINAYDALNRLVRMTDPNSGQVNYGLNALDQLASVTDPRNLVTSYAIDGLGNLNQQISPDTGTTTNTYDAAGNLLTSTDAKGQVTTYTYDALNRVASITFHDGSRQTYTYDQGVNGIGRLFRIDETDPQSQLTGRTDYGYDQKGRVISETRAVDSWETLHTTSYQYDGFGRLAGMTYPFSDGSTRGGSASYGFDGAGRIAQISTTYYDVSVGQMVTRVVVQNVQYHPFGGVKSFTFGNGQTYTRGFDQDGRIGSYTLGGVQYDVGYDPASRITSIAQNGNPPNTNTYGYDNLDRLTSAILLNTTFGYGYDTVGNRMSKTVGASTDTYAYPGTSNRLSSITPVSGPVRNYVHDANGSVTSDGLFQHVYDTRGRLIQSTNPTACLVSKFRINPLGQRVRKTVTRCDTGALVSDTIYLYDLGGRLIGEASPSGFYKRAYFYLQELPVGMYFLDAN